MASTKVDLMFNSRNTGGNAPVGAGTRTIHGTNFNTEVVVFPEGVSSYRTGTFMVPTDATGTVTFRMAGRRASGTAAANIMVAIDAVGRSDSEAADAAFVNTAAAAAAVDTVEGDMDIITWTETMVNLAWAANDIVFFRVGRTGAHASDTLAGDYFMYHFSIEIPNA